MLQLPYDPESREKGKDPALARDKRRLNGLIQKVHSSMYKGRTGRALRIMNKIGPVMERVGRDRVPVTLMNMLNEVM